MRRRNPAADQVAIVGVGRSRYRRDDPGASLTSITIDACVDAVRDAGLTAPDVDGVCGSLGVSDVEVQLTLGLPAVRWAVSHRVPFGFQLIEAVNAVFAGACDVALVYHSTYQGPRQPGADPLWGRAARVRAQADTPWRGLGERNAVEAELGVMQGGLGYAAWAGRYLHEFGVTREDTLGRVAVNNRTNAGANEDAIFRAPLTIGDYAASRMVREPLALLDMDVPVTGADAFIVTTAERGRDLAGPPVYVHASTIGRPARCREDQIPDLHHTGQEIVADTLWSKSELALADVDVFLPYDGFTIINLMWIESVGYCARGEGAAFLASHWSAEHDRLEIDGRVRMNTHGGNLSEGATQGSGALREAVRQLRGETGVRQVPDAKVALWTPGGFVWNAAGALLRVD